MLAVYIGAALAIALPGLGLRLFAVQVHPALGALASGISLLAAGFLLSWSAEAAEHRIGQALVVALLALITVMPEYAVDIYFAYQAGRQPGSDYTHFAAANMTGANRLLVGFAWPLIVLLNWLKTRQGAIALTAANAGEISFLGLASLYALVILLKNRIDVWDGGALLGIFALYLWRASRQGNTTDGLVEQDHEEEPESGPSGALLALPRRWQLATMALMMACAGAIVLLMAEPFAESLVATGEAFSFNHFLLVQWLAPLASEAPTVTLAVLLVLAGSTRTALGMMLSDKINQWTLLVAMLPLALSIGAGAVGELRLDARQHEEFLLTAAQSLFALSLLLGKRLGIAGALTLLVLFCLQLVMAFIYRDDESRAISHLTQFAVVYLALATLFAFRARRELIELVRATLGR